MVSPTFGSRLENDLRLSRRCNRRPKLTTEERHFQNESLDDLPLTFSLISKTIICVKRKSHRQRLQLITSEAPHNQKRRQKSISTDDTRKQHTKIDSFFFSVDIAKGTNEKNEKAENDWKILFRFGRDYCLRRQHNTTTRKPTLTTHQ